MADPTKLQQFYDMAKSNPTIKGLPDNYNDFASKMQNPAISKAFFGMVSQNATIKGLPEDYDSFASGLGLQGAPVQIPSFQDQVLATAQKDKEEQISPKEAMDRIKVAGQNILNSDKKLETGDTEVNGQILPSPQMQEMQADVSPVESLSGGVQAGLYPLVQSAKGVGEGLQQLSDIYDRSGEGLSTLPERATGAIKGLVQTGFGVAGLVNPSLSLFNTGTEIAGGITHENPIAGKIFDFVNSPGSVITKWIDGEDAPSWAKNTAEGLDTLWQFFLFKKGGDIVHGLNTAADLTKAFADFHPDAKELKEFHDHVQTTAVQKLQKKATDLKSDAEKETDPALKNVFEQEADKAQKDASAAIGSNMDNLAQKNATNGQISDIESRKNQLENKLKSDLSDAAKNIIKKQIDIHDTQIADLKKQMKDTDVVQAGENADNKLVGLPENPEQELPVDANNAEGVQPVQELSTEPAGLSAEPQPENIEQPLNNQEDAITEGKIAESNLEQYPNGDASGEEKESSNSNSNVESGESETQKEEVKPEHPDVGKQRINDLLADLREYSSRKKPQQTSIKGRQDLMHLNRRASDLGFIVKDGKLFTEEGKTVGSKRLSTPKSVENYQKLSDFDEGFQKHIEKLLPYVGEKYDPSAPNIDVMGDYKARKKGIRDIREGKATKESQLIFDAFKDHYDNGNIPIKEGAGGNLTKWHIPISEFDENVDSVRPEGNYKLAPAEEEQLHREHGLKEKDIDAYEKSIAESEVTGSKPGGEVNPGKEVREENEPKTGTGEGGENKGLEKQQPIKAENNEKGTQTTATSETQTGTGLHENGKETAQGKEHGAGNEKPTSEGKLLKNKSKSSLNNKNNEEAKLREQQSRQGNGQENGLQGEQPEGQKNGQSEAGKKEAVKNEGAEPKNNSTPGKEEQPLSKSEQREKNIADADKKIQEGRAKLEAIKNKKNLEGQQGIVTQKSGFSIDPDELEAWKEIAQGYIEKYGNEIGKAIDAIKEDFGGLLKGATDKDIKEQIFGIKEKEEPEQSAAIKKRIIIPEMKEMGKSGESPYNITMGQHRAEGVKLLESGEVPKAIEGLLKGSKKTVSQAEIESFRLYREKVLDPKAEKYTQDLKDAQKEQNVQNIDQAVKNHHELTKQYNDLYDAVRIAGKIAGQTVLAFKGLAENEYSMAATLRRATAAKNGFELSPEEHKFYSDAVEKFQKAVKELEDYKEAKRKSAEAKKAQDELDKESGLAKRSTARKGTIEKIRQDRQASKDIISKLLEKQRSEAHATVIPSLPPGVYVEIAKIAKGFVHEGVVKLADVIDRTLTELKDIDPNIAEKHIIDALSGNYEKGLKTRTELQKNIIELQRQANLTAKLHDLENGVANKKSVKTKGVDSPEVAELKKQIKEKHEQLFPKESPEEIASKRYKTYLENRVKKLQTQIQEGDFEKTPHQQRIYDAREMKLRTEIAKAKGVIDQKIYEQQKASEKWYEKAAGAMFKIRMFNLISSPLVFGKVLGHSVSEFAAHPFDEAGEWGMRKIFKNLSNLSEKGSPSLQSIKDYYSAIVSSDTYKDVWTQLKTYQNNLELAHGERIASVDDSYRHLPTNTFEKMTQSAGNLHTAEKLVLEHATYRESYSKRVMQFLRQNNGAELTDEQLALADGGAMVDALESIMRSRTWVSDKANQFSRGSKPADVALKILTPIRKVPLNIARQIAIRLGGLPVGLAELVSKDIRTMVNGKNTPEAVAMDNAFKHISKGNVGLLLFSVGLMNPDIFGGLYDQERKKKDLSAGGIKGLPDWIARIISANPLALTIQMGATLRRNIDDRFYSKGKSIMDIAGNTLLGITEEIPFMNAPKELEKATGSTKAAAIYLEHLTNTFYTPTFAGQLAAMRDTNPKYASDTKGHTQQRVIGKKDTDIKGKTWHQRIVNAKGDFAKDWSDAWKYHYPGLRETLKKK